MKKVIAILVVLLTLGANIGYAIPGASGGVGGLAVRR
jgi:hypothetical protein